MLIHGILPRGNSWVFCLIHRNGLDESIVRRYTLAASGSSCLSNELGWCIEILKEQNISSEMKPLNWVIWLRGEDQSSTMPGELQVCGYSGHRRQRCSRRGIWMRAMAGRRMSTWSLACVVCWRWCRERPWADLRSNYQIIVKVGMGQSPGVPDITSEEEGDFLEPVCSEPTRESNSSGSSLVIHKGSLKKRRFNPSFAHSLTSVKWGDSGEKRTAENIEKDLTSSIYSYYYLT